MRSKNEQQESSSRADYRDLRLLTEVKGEPEVTQRQLSHRVGIALGLTNVLLRNLMQKGYLRVSQSTWKRRVYNLTPEGLAHKIRLTVSYVHRVVDHYGRVRATLKEQLEPVNLHEESRVAIFGTGEFAELVYLGLRDIGVEEIDIYGPESLPGRKFLGLPIRDVVMLQPDRYDRVVVALLGDSEATQTELIDRGTPPEKIVTFFSDGKVEVKV